jgi:hypothetical protein
MPDADLIRAALKKVRRRQFSLILMNSSVVAILAFFFWMLLFKFGFIVLPWASIGIHLASAAFLFSAALAVSIHKMPSWKESVKLADQALGLQQRLETSWENIPPRDEIDSLLLADAGRRVIQLQPASVVPLRLGRMTVVCIFILLPAIASLGIIRVLQDWNNNSPGAKEAIVPRVLSGSSDQKKASTKAQEKSRANNSKTQNYIASDSSSETGRNSKSEMARTPADIPEQLGSPKSQKSPANSIPDSGAAGLEIAPANAPGLKHESADSAKRENRQPDNTIITKQEKRTESGSAATQNTTSQPNAGAASIRKAVKDERGTQASARLSLESKVAGNMLSAGLASGLSGKSIPNKKDVAFQNVFLQNYPAVWSAAEHALAKENIPPGMKKYIVDYFHAIHP